MPADRGDDPAARSRPILALIVGPAAAGKSAVSRRLADDLRARGDVVVRVELDSIAEMALPTLPDWAVANGIFATVVDRWLRASVSVVIAEGISNDDEVRQVLAAIPDGVPVIVVGLTTPFATALERALGDPSRGSTRDPGFLRGIYRDWDDARGRIRFDLVIDTAVTSIERSVAMIRAAIDAA